jgi:heat shock protein HslJ
MRSEFNIHIVLLAAGLLLAVPVAPAFAHQDKLAGADWVLAGQTGARAPFLRFEGGRVGGLGGCNRFGASYEIKGDSLSFSPIAATRMACESGMDTEQAFFDMLGKVKGLKLAGDRLELLDGQGKVLATFARRVAE